MLQKRKVLLVFLPSESGVDGARSLYAENESNSFFSWLNNSLRSIIKQSQFAIPPLSLMILSSIEVEGTEQSICDMRFEEFPFDRQWDLVGISVQTGMARKAFELAGRLRSSG
ncbi:MAG: B12-binding domain-containing radical SAM protein, partial [Chlorobiaceae bacterium]|nr:B12-binding domain-containing radical SAM protein [Chlorobiaceae bacterium]